MNQNTLIVSLLNTKEKIHTFYQQKNRWVAPIIKGVLMLLILIGTSQMFPFGALGGRNWLIGIIALVQAFLPLGTLYYIASAFVLLNLWKIGFDICIAFLMFVTICSICFFRVDNRYSYLAALVPVLCFCRLGILVPAVLAMSVGLEVLVPVCSGVIVYYFSLALKDALTLLSGTEGNRLGVGVAYVGEILLKNQTFFIVLAASFVTVIVTSLLYKLFHENAWLFAAIGGNAVMASAVIIGTLYFKVKLPVWMILAEMLAGILLCFLLELIRGIGDVTRIEKTVFEDDEYIYYVKAVPKIKVTQPEPNVKNMNESLQEEELSSAEELLESMQEEAIPSANENDVKEKEELQIPKEKDSEDVNSEEAEAEDVASEEINPEDMESEDAESEENDSEMIEEDVVIMNGVEEEDMDSFPEEGNTPEETENVVTGEDTDEY